jgi:CO/xanthine dehydrogenase Mo-binding subunit
MDTLEFRLRNTSDARDHAVLQAVARMSGWQPRVRPAPTSSSAVLTGRGISLARYGTGESRSSLVADVDVERATGKVRVTRAFIAFDCGLVINPDGAINQVEGGLLQGISRALYEEVRFDRRKVTTLNWADYPILRFSDVPQVQVELVARPDTPWSSAGEAGTVASASAVANAVFDATGKRPRRLPLTPDYVKSLLDA